MDFLDWFYVGLLLVYVSFPSLSLYKIKRLKLKERPDNEDVLFYNKMLLTSSVIAVGIVILTFGLPGELLVHLGWLLGLGEEIRKGAYITGLFASINAALIWPLSIPLGTLLLIFAAKRGWRLLRILAIPIVIIIWGLLTIFIVIRLTHIFWMR